MKIKQTITATLVLLFAQSCFPKFAPEIEVKEKFRFKDYEISWIKQDGVIDQNFPDLLILSIGDSIDTIGIAGKFSNVSIKDSIITMAAEKESQPKLTDSSSYIFISDNSLVHLNLNQYANSKLAK